MLILNNQMYDLGNIDEIITTRKRIPFYLS